MTEKQRNRKEKRQRETVVASHQHHILHNSLTLLYSLERGDASCLSWRYMLLISSLYRVFRATRLSFIVGVRIPFSGVQGLLSRVTDVFREKGRRYVMM